MGRNKDKHPLNEEELLLQALSGPKKPSNLQKPAESVQEEPGAPLHQTISNEASKTPPADALTSSARPHIAVAKESPW